MTQFKPKYISVSAIDSNGNKIAVVKKKVIESYNPSVLGLGDISNTSVATGVIAAIFDLEGFTNFCKQSDPQLCVPLFLSEYLDWIFKSIQKETCDETYPEGYTIWHKLPLLTKFMGDGLLVLWETEGMLDATKINLISSLSNICTNYKSEFFDTINKKVCEPPPALRCGAAMGTVYSVGDGSDYVGPCINLAARLQKLDNFTFAFARRGFTPEKHTNPNYLKQWVLKKANIRGIGNELIYFWASEFSNADPSIQEKYTDV